MLELLDSVRRHYPIGSIVLWESDQELESLSEVGSLPVARANSGGAAYIIDGFQRLSTLFGALRAKKSGEGRWNISYDLERDEFFHPRDSTPAHPSIAVRALLKTSDFLAECRRISSEHVSETRSRELIDKAENVARNFKNYQIPVVRIAQAELPTVARIFSRLNSRGTAISGDQMISALTYREGAFNLSSRLDDLREELDLHDFGQLERSTLLRTVLAAAGSDIYETDWAMIVEEGRRPARIPNQSQLGEAVQTSRQSLLRAIAFLKGEGVVSSCLLPYSLQLVLLAEFFRKCPTPDERMKSEVRRWFWTTSVTSHFASFGSDKARRAIQDMHGLAAGDIERIEGLEDGVLPIPERFNFQSARSRAFLVVLLSLSPLSLETGEPIPVNRVVAEPKRWIRPLLRNGLEADQLLSAANRIVIDALDTGSVKDCILNLADGIRQRVCESHGILSPGFEHLKAGRFSEFFKERRAYLEEQDHRFLSIRGVQLPIQAAPGEADAGEEDYFFDPPF